MNVNVSRISSIYSLQMTNMRGIAAALVLVSMAWAKKAVVELTPANFDELTRSGDWLIAFTAPWCGHCQHMKPAFKEAASKANGALSFQ